MKRYNLNKDYDVLVEKSGEYYAETLIDYLLEEKEIKLGWGKIEGISNDWISYRIVCVKNFKKIIKQAKKYCLANNINFNNQGINPYIRSWDSAFCPSNFTNQIYYICINRKGNKVLRKEGEFKNVKVLKKFPFSLY